MAKRQACLRVFWSVVSAVSCFIIFPQREGLMGCKRNPTSAVGAGFDQGFQEEAAHPCVYVHMPPFLYLRLCD